MKYRIVALILCSLAIISCKSKRSRSDSVLQGDSGWPPVRNAFTMVLMPYCNEKSLFEEDWSHSNGAIIVDIKEKIYNAYHRHYSFGSKCEGEIIGTEYYDFVAIRSAVEGQELIWTQEGEGTEKFNQIKFVQYIVNNPDHPTLTIARTIKDYGDRVCIDKHKSQDPKSEVSKSKCSSMIYDKLTEQAKITDLIEENRR